MDTTQFQNPMGGLSTDRRMAKTGTLSSRHFVHRVLLVEDSPESEDIMRKICEAVDEDMRLKCVKTAEEAETLLRSTQDFDLIISDHYLAGQETGIDLWRHCQSSLMGTPFLLTSTMTLDEFKYETDHDRTHPFFLQKPFNRKTCQQMIESKLGLPTLKERKAIQAIIEEARVDRTTAWLARLYALIPVVALTALFLMPREIANIESFISPRGAGGQMQSLPPLKVESSKKFEIKNIEKYQRRANLALIHREIIHPDNIFTPEILMRVFEIEARADEINALVTARWSRINDL